jgi:hypothetical protein
VLRELIMLEGREIDGSVLENVANVAKTPGEVRQPVRARRPAAPRRRYGRPGPGGGRKQLTKATFTAVASDDRTAPQGSSAKCLFCLKPLNFSSR